MVMILDSKGNLITEGCVVVFEPKGEYVFGQDGIVEPGEIGEVVQIDADGYDPLAPPRHDLCRCRVSFPRVDELRVAAGFPALFFAHPSELRIHGTELCGRYNLLMYWGKIDDVPF